MDAVEAKIPEEANTNNKLADKAWVTSQIDIAKNGRFVVVAQLPEVGESMVIYLVPRESPEERNIYDEYIYTDDKWEKIGSTDIDLSGYVKTEDLADGLVVDGNIEVDNLTINGTPILDLFATAEQGERADTAVQPADLSPYVQRTELEEGLEVDGNVEVNNITINGTPILDMFASAEQGEKADTAVQPADLSPYVQRTELEDGLAVDGNVEVNNLTINGTPILDMFATSEQGARADTAVQPPDLSPYVQRTELEEGLAVDGNVEVSNITINNTPILDMFAEIKEQIRRHHANFAVNNEFFTDSLNKAIDWLNNTRDGSEKQNVILVRRDIDLDETDLGREIPPIAKGVVIDFQGHTLSTKRVCSHLDTSRGDWDGAGNKIFRINDCEAEIPVTLKNVTINIDVDEQTIGVIYNESLSDFIMSDVVINCDLTKATIPNSAGYWSEKIIQTGGDSGCTLNNVTCHLVTNRNNQCCFETQCDSIGGQVMNLNNCDFSQTVVDQTTTDLGALTRTCAVIGGYMNVININGGTYTSRNSRSTLASFTSGVVYNISNGAIIKAEADDGVAIGYAIGQDIVDGTNAKINISGRDTMIITDSDCTGNNKPMFGVLSMGGGHLDINIEGGEYNKFSVTATNLMNT